MAGGWSWCPPSTLEERLAKMELDFSKVKDYVFGWPLDAVENANAKQILELQEIVGDMKRHVPNMPVRSDAISFPRDLNFEGRIRAMEGNLAQMKDYLSSSPFEFIGVSNAVAIADLCQVVLEVKEHIVKTVMLGSTLSPCGCYCPNRFNVPSAQVSVESSGAQLCKIDKLRRDVQWAISETTGYRDLVLRLSNVVGDEDDTFEDYEPTIPSDDDDYGYDSDRSPKGV